MNKKQYQAPQTKVMRIKAQQMICSSMVSSSQNESYEEVNVSEEGWY